MLKPTVGRGLFEILNSNLISSLYFNFHCWLDFSSFFLIWCMRFRIGRVTACWLRYITDRLLSSVLRWAASVPRREYDERVFWPNLKSTFGWKNFICIFLCLLPLYINADFRQFCSFLNVEFTQIYTYQSCFSKRTSLTGNTCLLFCVSFTIENCITDIFM